MRLVSIAARQHRRRGQRHVIRIGVVVRVLIVQREDGDLSCGGLLAQTAMALREDAGDMPARNIRRIEPVARPIVEVRDVRRVGDRIVELDARPRRLLDRQLRVVHVLRQAAAAHKPARRRIAALLVHAAHRCEAPKQRPVVFEIDARHTQILHRRAAGQQLLPVDQRAAVDHQTCNRCRTLKRQPRVREAVQADQFQRLQCCRKRRCRQRSTRSERDAPQRGVTSHERLQLQVVRQIERREAVRFQSRDVQRPQVQAVRDDECGERRLALGTAHVQSPQRRAVVQVERLQQCHRNVR